MLPFCCFQVDNIIQYLVLDAKEVERLKKEMQQQEVLITAYVCVCVCVLPVEDIYIYIYIHYVSLLSIFIAALWRFFSFFFCSCFLFLVKS